MAFQSYRSLAGPLWIAGPREQAPPNTMRRNRSCSLQEEAGAVRSRLGLTPLHPSIRLSDPVAITQFHGDIFVVSDTGVLTTDDGTSILTGLTGGNTAPFAQGPSVAGVNTDDYLFFSDASGMHKVATDNSTSRWGLEAPSTTSGTGTGLPFAFGSGQKTSVIDPFDSTSGWTIDLEDNDITSGPSTDSIIQTDGTSVTFTVAKNGVGAIVKTSLSLDLTQVGTPPVSSPDEDWIGIAIRLGKPRRVDAITLILASDTDFNSSFSFEVLIDDRIGRKRRRSQRRRGLADLPGVSNAEEEFKVTVPGEAFRIEAADLLGDSVASSSDNTWAILKIPKLAFTENGPSANWAMIKALKVVVKTNRKGNCKVWVDDWKLIGGVGMQGKYRYRVTFKNSTTQHRSNGGPEPLDVDLNVSGLPDGIAYDIDRESVTLINIPTANDPQVDTREIWRTIGNGFVYFKVTEINDNTTTVFVDDYADYPGLHGFTDHVLSSEVLPDDNAPPETTYKYPQVHAKRMWWADPTTGRVFYSPVGRYESVLGFVQVAGHGTVETLQAIIEWDDQLYVGSTLGWYVILGSEEPFIVRRLPGVPGTFTSAGAVVPTPQGIVYAALNGMRLLRGNRSDLMGFDALAPVFKRMDEEATDTEGLVAGVYGIAGAMTPDGRWVYVSNSETTLAWDFQTNGWRDVGIPGVRALFTDGQGHVLVGIANVLGNIETNVYTFGGTFDGPSAPGTAIAWTLEPNCVYMNADRRAALVRNFAYTANTGGELVTPVVIVDGVEVSLPPFATTQLSTVEYPINRWGRVVSGRLTASLTTAHIECTEMAYDVYLPEPRGAIAPAVDVPNLAETQSQPVAADAIPAA